jgi:hypothetical protein
MSLDDILFGLIIAGIGLCAAYVRAEYIGWRDHIAAEMRKRASIRELYIRESSRREDADPIRHAVNFETLVPRRGSNIKVR